MKKKKNPIAKLIVFILITTSMLLYLKFFKYIATFIIIDFGITGIINTIKKTKRH